MRQNMYLRIALTLLLLALSASAQAEFDWQAKYAGDFLTGQSNARLLGMGGVGVAAANGPSAVFANPARIFPSRTRSVSLMHADRFSGVVKVDHASMVELWGAEQAIGFGIIRQGIDDIPVTELQNPALPPGADNRPRIIDHASASDYAFQLSYATMRPYGQVGATAKLIYRHLYENNAFGLGIDIGYSRSFGNLTVGAQLRDALSTILVWDTGRQEGIVPTARIGAAYQMYFERQHTGLMPVVEMQMRGESIDDPDFVAMHAGLEAVFSGLVAARVGVDDKRLTYGAGILIGPVNLDYAFVGHDDLGNTHRVSIVVHWGAIS